MAKNVTDVNPLRVKQDLKDILPKIELMDPDLIQTNAANPRKLTERAFKDLVKSVDSFWQMLFLRPIIVDDENIAIGGEKRLLASRQAGFLQVPVIRASQLTVRQRREFILKDNLHSGEWDMDSLANNWDSKDLSDWGFKAPDYQVKAKEVKFTAKVKEPVFDIVLKAQTELERQELITRLDAAGFKEGVDFE